MHYNTIQLAPIGSTAAPYWAVRLGLVGTTYSSLRLTILLPQAPRSLTHALALAATWWRCCTASSTCMMMSNDVAFRPAGWFGRTAAKEILPERWLLTCAGSAAVRRNATSRASGGRGVNWMEGQDVCFPALFQTRMLQARILVNYPPKRFVAHQA